MPSVRACALFASLFPCNACANESPRDEFLRYEIVATHPHDVASFTQGLLWHEGKLLESSGGYGRSELSLRDARTGVVQARRTLPPSQFAEGVAADGRRFLQLTWQSGIALVYDFALKPVGRFAYTGEGWGLAWDGARWLMSDGSHRVTARAADSFAPTATIEVRDRGRAVSQLNELEFVDGRLYANVWHTDRIAVIDPRSGAVDAWIDLSALKKGFAKPAGWNEREHVLNGIAFDPASRHFFVTGKAWPVMFELRVTEPRQK